MLSFIPTLLQLSCLLIPSILPANAYPSPGACTGPCNVHDPALIRREDGTYFRFSTGNKISYASAPAVEGPWTALGSVLPDGSIIDMEGRDDLWVCLFPTSSQSLFTYSMNIAPTEETGPRHSARQRCLPPLLHSQHIRHPNLSNRPSHIPLHGPRVVDRPRRNGRLFQRRLTLQRHRREPVHRRANALRHLWFLLDRPLPGAYECGRHTVHGRAV